jgi:hypothetical protein
MLQKIVLPYSLTGSDATSYTVVRVDILWLENTAILCSIEYVGRHYLYSRRRKSVQLSASLAPGDIETIT